MKTRISDQLPFNFAFFKLILDLWFLYPVHHPFRHLFPVISVKLVTLGQYTLITVERLPSTSVGDWLGHKRMNRVYSLHYISCNQFQIVMAKNSSFLFHKVRNHTLKQSRFTYFRMWIKPRWFFFIDCYKILVWHNVLISIVKDISYTYK